jgi:hypothetical protein
MPISNEFPAFTTLYTIKMWLKVVKMSDCLMTLYVVPANAKDRLACPKEFGPIKRYTSDAASVELVTISVLTASS